MKIYLISDCHGNISGLMRALEKHKIIDSKGNRQLARKHQVFSIGDLANCVEDSWIGDIACLDMVGNIIDGMVLGNHELPYLDPSNSFGGFKWHEGIAAKMNQLMAEDLIGAAILHDRTLISHAGVSKHFIVHEDQDNAKYWFEKLEDQWNARNFDYGLFSSVGWHRGGRDKVGGIFWCDFDHEFVPTSFPQIVGHTPRCVRFLKNSLCIDVGAKDQETEPFILEVG